MDSHSNAPKQVDAAKKSTGCCSGKSDTQGQVRPEPRVAESAKEKPAKSGCCCSH